MAEQLKPMTARELSQALDRFISDNRHSHDVVMRWLASRMTDTLTMFGEIISAKGIGPELRTLVNEFRAEEIDREIATKQRDVETLEREKRKLAAA